MLKFFRFPRPVDCAAFVSHPISMCMNAFSRLAALALIPALLASPVLSATEAEEPFTLIRDASDTSLEEWAWIKRVVVVFADSPNDPRFAEQMRLIEERPEALLERDVVVITDTDPKARSEVRKALRARGFMLVVLAKDGSVVIRKPAPWDMREISRSIDKLPLRQQEIRER
ncbi:hypothetical protein TRP8649_03106 [Pelagimonas phthalicica]|uniref:DUF4174 domain-containing protein n=2 Tax=Pelagimonas phthalicica TaxID=1037362 RepID=A0A238JE88_9RHOB|nr:uncharacterized protein DUF4174 [Pelagimonas phthalicica]SMX28978.1 hypothetical protein TRP8649_03106 [Pelagimonas phthalicica]